MKINEGMYVRTEKGKISKIKWITAQKWEGLENTVEASFMLENNESFEYPRDNFKASNYIIDLIEENDLVKIEYYSLRYEKRVTRLFEVDYIDKEYLVSKNAYCTFRLKNNEWSKSDKKLKPIVKEILTKEQYENNCYKVDDK